MDGCKYGLIGQSLMHSDSPLIHALFGNNEYMCYSMEPERLASFLEAPSLRGLNVTIPYKRDVLKYCSSLDAVSKSIGSVNTMVRDSMNKWIGYNTDAFGLRYVVHNAGFRFQGENVCILGNGGVSQTVQAVARQDGAASVTVVSRSGACNYTSLNSCRNATILINATPVGMMPNFGEKLVNLQLFPLCRAVIDLIYNPFRTAFLLDAEQLGIRYTNGFSMLVAQAKQAEEIFLSRKINNQQIAEVGRKVQKMKENIVLIGMPGAGKSTIGRTLSEIAKRELFDVDFEIEKKEGKSIPEILMSDGELYFRDVEHRVLCEACQRQGQVIVTGGGAVLNEHNCSLMRQNGRIYNVFRPLDLLVTEGRPLSIARGIEQIYKDRKQIYERVAQKQIENTASVEEVARSVWREFCENTCLEWPEFESIGNP